MNMEQISYTTKRIRAIAQSKLDRIRDKYENFSMSFEERYKCIKAGKAKLKEFERLSSYTDLKDAYIFPGEEKFHQDQEKHNAEQQKRRDAIETERDKLLDQVHLGEDAKKIIELIEKFASKKF